MRSNYLDQLVDDRSGRVSLAVGLDIAEVTHMAVLVFGSAVSLAVRVD